MAYAGLSGSKRAYIGPSPWSISTTTPSTLASTTLDAAGEALIMIGQIETSDEAAHTINTTGSSSIAWRTGAVTFANAGTTVTVGIAAVDLTTGPPARAVNVSNVITFDVSKSLVGGGSGITANAMQTHVPDTGTKTIANGDMVAVCIQMTARAGVDVVTTTTSSTTNALQRNTVTAYTGAAYASDASYPNVFITFADGATAWFSGAAFFSTISGRVWNSGSATKEFGQLYQFGFPVKIYGLYGWVAPAADFDLVLYSAPLGTPVAERTSSFDANTSTVATGRRFEVLFSAPYSLPINTPIGAVYKPGSSSITAYYATLSDAGQRVSYPWGTDGYGISRASGAFADANSSLDHYYIGLIVGAFDAGGSGRVARVNDISLVA